MQCDGRCGEGYGSQRGLELSWNAHGEAVGKSLSQEVSRALRIVVGKLVQREWKSAMEFLVEYVETPRTDNGRLAKEVASSLVTEKASELRGCFELVPAHALIQVLLLHDDLLTLALAGERHDDASPVVEAILEGWRGLSGQERAANEMRLLSSVQSEYQIDLVVEVLGEVKAEKLIEAVELIWNEREMRSPKLGDAFCDAALAKAVGEKVRAVFARARGNGSTDLCIARLLMPNGQDMKWVLENPQLGERRTRVLGLFVEGAKQVDLEAAFGEREVAADTLDIFMRSVDEYKAAAAKMVVLPTLTAEQQVEHGLELYAYLEPSERKLVGLCIASRILSDFQERNAQEIDAALNTVLPDIHVLKLIEEVFGVDREGTVVSELLERIEGFTGETRSFIERYDIRIVELIAGRDKFDLTASGALSLTRLIVRAKSRATDRYVQMCCTVLPFALSGRNTPASP